MITLRPSNERGDADHGWLRARHSFSFAGYHDRAHMGFRGLRVMNEDVVAGSQGFGTHGHANMEIFTWVVSGSLAHRDSMGSHKVVGPGMVQYMSAGSGVEHSEINASPEEPVHLYQTWIIPRERDTAPRYEDRDFRVGLAGGGWVEILSPDGAGGGIAMVSDARVLIARPAAGTELRHALAPGRGAWLQVIKGRATANGHAMAAGDGAAIEDEAELLVSAVEDAEVMLIDLP
jgi:redox-sensitive bicupin YhaK (pirin superfamily)